MARQTDGIDAMTGDNTPSVKMKTPKYCRINDWCLLFLLKVHPAESLCSAAAEKPKHASIQLIVDFIMFRTITLIYHN